MTSSPPLRAAVYLRISEDKKADGLAIERQRGDSMTLLQQRGWTLTRIYSDTVSAYLRDVKRPEYEQMQEDFKAGRFDAIAVYDLDRLTRQPRELEDWIDLAEHKGLTLVTATGEADLTTDAGRLFARLKAAVSRGEIERKSARQKRKNKELLDAGKPILGNRPFGFKLDRLTFHEPEAQMIRDAVADVINGTSIGEIVRRWNDSGVPPTSKAKDDKPARWTHPGVRQILRRERNAGIMTHLSAEDRRKNKDRKEEGLPPIEPKVINTDGPQIITPEQLELLSALIDSRTTSRGAKPQRHFLSGAMLCACGGTMRIYHSSRNSRHAGQTFYTCGERAKGDGKTHTAIKTNLAERKAVMALYGFISGGWIDPPTAPGTSDLPTLRAAIADNTAERSRLSGLLATRGVDPVPIQAQLSALADAADKLDRELKDALARGLEADWVRLLREEWGDSTESFEKFEQWWESHSIERRRDFVRQSLRIQVMPGRGVSRVKVDPR
ncbi:recombinase family protein [Agromyces sp. SYSU T00194]|uniref:recombinase family protein n=1 Tax=Agromyces chitinivorans TaxID=3158560 RepID=UPI003399B98C